MPDVGAILRAQRAHQLLLLMAGRPRRWGVTSSSGYIQPDSSSTGSTGLTRKNNRITMAAANIVETPLMTTAAVAGGSESAKDALDLSNSSSSSSGGGGHRINNQSTRNNRLPNSQNNVTSVNCDDIAMLNDSFPPSIPPLEAVTVPPVVAAKPTASGTSTSSASTSDDPHRCDICGKTFAVPARLTRHYRTHTGSFSIKIYNQIQVAHF